MQLLELILPVKLYCVLTLVCLFSEMLYLAIVHKGVPAPSHPLTQLAFPLFKIFVSLPLFSVLPPFKVFWTVPPHATPSCPNLTNQPFLV